MRRFLSPPLYKPEQTGPEADHRYRKLRLQVFIGAFIGYAAFYIVRKNFSMAIPMLEPFGLEKGELGTVLAMNAVAYALSKFLMGAVSDRSDARKFLPLGLVLASISMMFMIVPISMLGPEHHTAALVLMGVLNFLVGWFNGMGWPPCGRVMTTGSRKMNAARRCPSGTAPTTSEEPSSGRWPSTGPSGSDRGSTAAIRDSTS